MFHYFLKRAVTTALLCLPLFLLLSANAGEQQRSITIADVEDGNTLVTGDGVKLRLIDIRLPEAKALQDLLVKYLQDRLKGREVVLEKDHKELDEDGALLVYLFIDDELINAEVLAKGLATMKHQTVNTRYQVRLFKSQAEAYKAGYGLWGGRAAPRAGEAEAEAVPGAGGSGVSPTRPATYERFKKEVLITPERLNNEGVEKAAKGDLEGAMTDWQRAAQLMPQAYPPRFNLSLGKIEQGRYAEAEELIKELLKEKPEEARLHTMLGRALLGQDKPDEALAAHKKALSIKPDLYEARLNIAQTHEATGDFERALYEYNRTAAQSPNDPYLYLRMGELYQARGEDEKAVKNYNKSLELSPGAAFTSAVQGRLAAMEAQKGLGTDVLSAKLLPALVQVQVTRTVPHPMLPLTRTIRQTTTGAGFIINGRGEVITSAALISEADEIVVRVYDREIGSLMPTPYPAERVASRRIPTVAEVPFLDFALIRMSSPPRGLQPLELGSASDVKTEDRVYSAGYPGGNAHKLLEGMITDVQYLPGDEKQRIAMLKSYPAIKASPVKKVKLLITDLGIDEGLGGSPLVNKAGVVIGVNVTKLPGYEGQSVALDIDSARTALQR